MGDLSAHFDRAEFACKDGCGYGQPHPRLVQVLEQLRATIRRPLPIVSGLRCPVRNREVGGAVRSRHQSGEAADLPSRMIRESQARGAGATGIGLDKEGWVIHVDVRRAQRPVVWHY